MVATIIISVITFVSVIASILFFPKLKIGKIRLDTYWIIALIGAVILLVTSLAPIKEVGEELISNKAINPLKILVLFFSMTAISIVLDELGLFRYLASVASKHAKDKQIRLFIALYFLTAFLTIFTSNDIVILTLTPFICFFSQRSKINPLPYLVAEFVAANTWSLMFIIGNPTNIYLATSAGINFISYFKVMAVPTIVGGILELLILLLIFYRKLKEPIMSDPTIEEIKDKPALIVGVSILVICLVFLIISSYINLEMWLISLICALTLLLFMLIYSIFRKENFINLTSSLKRLPYQLIPFFLSMFVIVVALNSQGISGEIAKLLGNSHPIWVYGYSSFIASNLINNIPMSILFTNIASSLSDNAYLEAIYASIVGSNIGAFLTPIGALAGIMFTSLVNKNEVKFSFIDFIKYGVIISIPVITSILALTKVFILINI